MIYRVLYTTTVKREYLVEADFQDDAEIRVMDTEAGIDIKDTFLIDDWEIDTEISYSEEMDFSIEDVNDAIDHFTEYAIKNFKDFNSVLDLPYEDFQRWTTHTTSRELDSLERLGDLVNMFSDSKTIKDWYERVESAICETNEEDENE